MDRASLAEVECAPPLRGVGALDSVPPPRSGVGPRGEGSKAPPTFAEMYKDGFAFVWRNLHRLGVAPEAVRDAAQDVFLVVHKRIDSYDGSAAVKTWLFAITMRVASQYRRSARRAAARAVSQPQTPESDPLDRAISPQPNPFEELEAREANRLLLELLDELDDERRAVFVLTELEQMSAPEIAEALGVNLNTVYGRLRTARQQFNQALTRFRARKPVGRERLP
jgi:RNA polymerase sigma-70 factor (ECF subfamily)